MMDIISPKKVTRLKNDLHKGVCKNRIMRLQKFVLRGFGLIIVNITAICKHVKGIIPWRLSIACRTTLYSLYCLIICMSVYELVPMGFNSCASDLLGAMFKSAVTFSPQKYTLLLLIWFT